MLTTENSYLANDDLYAWYFMFVGFFLWHLGHPEEAKDRYILLFSSVKLPLLPLLLTLLPKLSRPSSRAVYLLINSSSSFSSRHTKCRNVKKEMKESDDYEIYRTEIVTSKVRSSASWWNATLHETLKLSQLNKVYNLLDRFQKKWKIWKKGIKLCWTGCVISACEGVPEGIDRFYSQIAFVECITSGNAHPESVEMFSKIDEPGIFEGVI